MRCFLLLFLFLYELSYTQYANDTPADALPFTFDQLAVSYNINNTVGTNDSPCLSFGQFGLGITYVYTELTTSEGSSVKGIFDFTDNRTECAV